MNNRKTLILVGVAVIVAFLVVFVVFSMNKDSGNKLGEETEDDGNLQGTGQAAGIVTETEGPAILPVDDDDSDSEDEDTYSDTPSPTTPSPETMPPMTTFPATGGTGTAQPVDPNSMSKEELVSYCSALTESICKPQCESTISIEGLDEAQAREKMIECAKKCILEDIGTACYNLFIKNTDGISDS